MEPMYAFFVGVITVTIIFSGILAFLIVKGLANDIKDEKENR